MATIAREVGDAAVANRFFRTLAILMALVVILGFSMQYLAGRSTFTARPLVHAHGLTYMGWVALFVTQSWLATRGPIAMHRRLGWFGAGWAIVMVFMAFWIVIDVVRRGSTPFFFQPQHFLIANPLSALVFAALAWSAIRLRRQTDWHMRLHICAMAAIIGPGFGRILPMPLLIPYAFDIAVLAGLIFPAAGMIRDLRRDGKVHPAWWSGSLAIVAMIPLSHLVANSALGASIYASLTAGHPSANIPGLAFAPPPPMP